MPPVPEMPPLTTRLLPPTLSKLDAANSVVSPDRVPSPAVLPTVPAPINKVLATLAPALMLSRLPPSVMVPVPAAAVAPLTTKVPAATVVPPA